MEKMELIDELQVHYEGFAKRMKGRIYYDDQETKSLLEGYAEELAGFIFKELDKAREEGREESKREYAQAIATGQKVELTEELVDRIWSANLEEMYKMGLTKLLKTKEDGK